MAVDLKLYVISLNKVFVPESKYLVPIQVGAANTDVKIEGYLHDDEGDNISKWNGDFCEMTGIYWVWKQCKSDYVGFFHYRRYLSLEENVVRKRRTYWMRQYIHASLSQKIFDQFGVDAFNVEQMKQYDVFVPNRSHIEEIEITDYYRCFTEIVGEEEMDYATHALLTVRSDLKLFADQCRTTKRGFHCNLFIMKQEIFEEYCECIFPALFALQDSIDKGEVKKSMPRNIGFVAEYLTGIFLTYCMERYRVKEIPAIFFKYTDGEKHRGREFFESLYPVFRMFAPYGSARERMVYKAWCMIRGTKRRGGGYKLCMIMQLSEPACMVLSLPMKRLQMESACLSWSGVRT